MDFIVSLLVSVLSGMGVGGGGLLVIYLTLFLGKEQFLSQGINLLFFLAASVSSLFIHLRQRRIDWRAVTAIALIGSAGVLLGAALAGELSGGILRKIFAGFMIVAGALQLFKREEE